MSASQGYILLADDDLEDQYFIKIAVHELNPALFVKTVDNGAQALIYLNKIKKRNPMELLPLFIITDVNMPRVNGYDFLAKIKKTKLKNIPVFVLTTSNHETSHKRLLELGALKCYVKPTDPAQLKHIIAEMIELSYKNS